ncbi:stalled ribosome sensor GCN1-like [Zophobas morio]|uniref:stalled ribosome sensor GCN1-like n=1 Tax=Zophobas morio TaxID=2755281 RepID=UPI00308352CD
MSELENYRSTIALLTLDDFEKLIIPPLAKLFLKSGSFASGVLLHILAGLQIDVSTQVSRLMEHLLASMLSKDPLRRKNAVEALGYLLMRVDEHSIVFVCNLLLTSLEGKGPALVSWDVKLVVANCLSLSVGLRAVTLPAGYGDRIVTCVKREANANVRQSLCSALARFYYKRPLSDAVIHLLQENLPLPAHASISRLLLLHFLATLDYSRSRQELVGLLPALQCILVNSETHASQLSIVWEGILAAAVLVFMELRHAVGLPRDMFNVFCSWRVLNSTHSSEAYLKTLLDLCILKIPENHNWLIGVLRLSVHHIGGVRRYARERFLQFCKKNISLNFVKRFSEIYLRFTATMDISFMRTPTNEPRKTDKVTCLQALVSSAGRLTSTELEVFAALMMPLFLHPSVDQQRPYLRALRKLCFSLPEFTHSRSQEFQCMVKELLTSSEDQSIARAMCLIKFLSRHGGHIFVEHFANYAVSRVFVGSIQNISERDFKCYLSEEGVSFTRENAPSGEDTCTAPHVLHEGPLPTEGHTSILTKYQPEKIDKELHNEGRARQFVALAKKEINIATSIFRILIESCPTEAKATLVSVIGPFLVRHFRGVLFPSSEGLWLQLSRCCSQCYSDLFCLIGHTAIRITLPSFSRPDDYDLLSRVFLRVHSLCDEGKLTPADFAYFFELLKLSFRPETNVPVHILVAGLEFVGAFLALGSPLPSPLRLEMFKFICSVIISFETLQVQAAELLRHLCGTVPALNEEELLYLSSSLLHSNANLRLFILEALYAASSLPTCDLLVTHTFMLREEQDEAVNLAASRLWDRCGFILEERHCERLLVTCETLPLERQPLCFLALTKMLAQFPSVASRSAVSMVNRFVKLNAEGPGSSSPKQSMDFDWHPRVGVAGAIKTLAPFLQPEPSRKLFTTLLIKGLPDPHERVREAVFQASVALVERQGKHSALLLPLLEKRLEHPSLLSAEASDQLKACIITIMGVVAQHLKKNDPQIPVIIERLLDTLETPSQCVQEAISNCLSPLMKVSKISVKSIFSRLLRQLFEGKKYSQRKGAAYGLAGVAKGLEMRSLRENNVIPTLFDAIKSKDINKKEGALLAVEALIGSLGSFLPLFRFLD